MINIVYWDIIRNNKTKTFYIAIMDCEIFLFLKVKLCLDLRKIA